MRAEVRQAISSMVTIAVLAATSAVMFHVGGGLFWCTVGILETLVAVWGLFQVFEPWREEAKVLKCLDHLGGRASERELDTALIELTGESTWREMEDLEALREAASRLRSKGRITNDGNDLVLVRSNGAA